MGDHAPAYLINLWLATGEDGYAEFLSRPSTPIAEHFPDYDISPFVQERFPRTGRADRAWGWQQDRGRGRA